MAARGSVDPPVVLYRDAQVLAVSKPSGLLVHRGWGRDRATLVDWAQALAGVAALHPIGRLDRGASGVALLALSLRAGRELQALKRHGLVRHAYLALVRGVAPASGLIDHPLPARSGRRRTPAQTAFACLASVAAEPRSWSLVDARPRQGRAHQVRRHLRHISHPLAGDSSYGRGDLNRALAERYGLCRLALHAYALELPACEALPDGLHLTCGLPQDLAGPLAALGFAPAQTPGIPWHGGESRAAD